MTETVTPAQWLIAEYDATDPEEYARDQDTEAELDTWGTVYVQPIFTLKSVTEPGAAMRVTPSDYCDPGRWWL